MADGRRGCSGCGNKGRACGPGRVLAETCRVLRAGDCCPSPGTAAPRTRPCRNQKGYVAGYNGQLSVTADQVIVGAMLSQHPVDRTLLHPWLDTCRQQLSQAGIRPRLHTVLADAGYVSEENFARADTGKLRLLAPLAKDPGRRHARTPQRARHLDQYPAAVRRPGRADAVRPRLRDGHEARRDGGSGWAVLLACPGRNRRAGLRWADGRGPARAERPDRLRDAAAAR